MSAEPLATVTPQSERPPRPTVPAAIAGLGVALPARIVPNSELAPRLGVTPQWIERRTGIRERRYAAPGQRVSDLAAGAGRLALADAALAASELDMLLVATVAADELTPSAAPIVADLLGADTAAAIDIGAACTGSLSALALAAAAVESGRASNVLVIGAEILTRFIDAEDRRTAPLFGDGAGALLVRAGGEGRIGPFVFASDGSNADTIRATRAAGVLEMDGHETFLRAVEHLSASTLQVIARAQLTLQQIDLFVYHQANARILSAVGERLALPPGRVFDCIASFGNTSAASLPIALAEAVRTGALRPGAKVLLGAIGAGLVWGASVVTWGTSR